MGNKLTKKKSASITEQQTILPVTNEIPTDTANTQTKQAPEKKIKKKSRTKGSKTMVDQSTNTDHYLLMSPTSSEQLVGDQASSPIHAVQINAAYQTESVEHPISEFQQLRSENGPVPAESNRSTMIDSLNETDQTNPSSSPSYGTGEQQQIENSTKME